MCLESEWKDMGRASREEFNRGMGEGARGREVGWGRDGRRCQREGGGRGRDGRRCQREGGGRYEGGVCSWVGVNDPEEGGGGREGERKREGGEVSQM